MSEKIVTLNEEVTDRCRVENIRMCTWMASICAGTGAENTKM